MTSALMLLAAAGLVAACGKASHPETVARPPAGTPRPASSGTVSEPQARAFAHAVNLTLADVPGFRAAPGREHEHETAAEQRLEHEMLLCLGASVSGSALTEASSQNFERESNVLDQTVKSEVTVAHSSAVAAKGLASVKSAHARTCLSRYLNMLFRDSKYRGARFGRVSISEGSPPSAGTTGSYGWRIAATITTHGIQIPFYVDILGFVDGPAAVSLFSSGAPVPLPAATEQQLYLTLLARARAHRL
jgi:hypothetical protein